MTRLIGRLAGVGGLNHCQPFQCTRRIIVEARLPSSKSVYLMDRQLQLLSNALDGHFEHVRFAHKPAVGD